MAANEASSSSSSNHQNCKVLSVCVTDVAYHDKQDKIGSAKYSTDPNKGYYIKGHYLDDEGKPTENFVALKCYEHVRLKKEVTRDLRALRAPKSLHPNFIRYIGFATEGEFTFIVTEMCLCSVAELFAGKREDIPYGDIAAQLPNKEILRQATEAVSCLHNLGIIHRNLHPNNFLISTIANSKHFIIKLTDFHCSKYYEQETGNSCTLGSGGWIAPESQITGVKLNESIDVFILGCFFFFVLNDEHKHPFEVLYTESTQEKGTWSNRISLENDAVYKQNWNMQIASKCTRPTDMEPALVQKMIKFRPNDRISLGNVLDDIYFQPDDDYPLYGVTNVTPGLCVIINQEFYTEDGPRYGSNVDAESLKQTFTKFGFDVLIKKNLTGTQLEGFFIHELKQQNFSKYASLVVCILAHGNSGHVTGIDKANVPITTLQYTLSETGYEHLIGKPKIFIIQACQGKKHQNAAESPMEVDSTGTEDTCNQTDATPFPPNNEKELKGTSDHYRIPRLIDNLTLISTIDEHVSYRDEYEGSYFIKELCKHLKLEYSGKEPSRHLYELFRSGVLVDVSKEDIEYKNQVFKQTPEWRSTLRKNIRFKPIGENVKF